MAALIDPETSKVMGFACGPEDVLGVSDEDLQKIKEFAEFLKTAGPAPKPKRDDNDPA